MFEKYFCYLKYRVILILRGLPFEKSPGYVEYA